MSKVTDQIDVSLNTGTADFSAINSVETLLEGIMYLRQMDDVDNREMAIDLAAEFPDLLLSLATSETHNDINDRDIKPVIIRGLGLINNERAYDVLIKITANDINTPLVNCLVLALLDLYYSDKVQHQDQIIGKLKELGEHCALARMGVKSIES